jgi:hypothetical protein
VTHFINAVESAQIYAALCLEVLLFALAIRKRVYRVSIFFAIYVYLFVPRDIALMYIFYTKYFRALWFIYSFYISDVFLNFLRLLVIVEIGIRTLRGYHTIWHFTWRILVAAGSALFLWGAITALRHWHPTQQLILTVQQYLSITQDLLLLVVLAVGLYYRVNVTPLFRSIVTGICIFAAIQIFNSELGRYIANPTNSIFDIIQRLSFFAMILIWVWALWKWPGTIPAARQTISQGQYDDLSPQVHDRLRDLNDRLSRIKKNK